MAIALGVLMQVLTLAAVKIAGGKDPALGILFRDTLQKISWSTLVCVGLAVGAAAQRARAAWMGLMGLLAAPLGFVSARMVQKGITQALDLTPVEQIAIGVLIAVLALKALEYGALGLWLYRLGTRERGLWPHAGAGLAAGLTFGAAVVAVLYFSADPRPPAARVAALAANELIFPIGCSIVLYAAQLLGKRLSAAAS